MKLKVGDKEFNVKVASSDANRKKGLKGIKKVPKGHGLVLSYSKEQLVPITMKGVKCPLDIVFARGGKVHEVRKAPVNASDIVLEHPSDLVLEINMGEGDGIRTGDEISWVGDMDKNGTVTMATGGVAAKKNQMHVLDEDGKNQMNLKGEERIYSRPHTSKLVKLAVKADKTKDNKDYKKLGNAMVKIIHEQDTQEQEYVE